MKITFIGTRGEIDPQTTLHKRHTATMISYLGKRVLIDCGRNWLGKFEKFRPHQIVLTHAHPDHAYGLKSGSPCPVWATKETWKLIDSYPIEKKKRHIIPPRKCIKISGIQFEAFPVLHSVLCPAVGYRIKAGKKTIFYVPDVAWIPDIEEAFHKIALYVGDGATIHRNMIRKTKDTEEIFGHATIRQQLTWCRKQNVSKMIITHCGSDIVGKNKKKVKSLIDRYAKERGVEAEIVYDGMELIL